VESAGEGELVDVGTERTPFYGESGGQVGDTGRLESEHGLLEVQDAQKPVAGLIVHRARVASGIVSSGDVVKLHIDSARRDAIRRNHSVTHLLHLGLRRILGEHAQQKGSIVAPDRFRFDFTHDRPLTDEQLAELEDFVLERILKNLPVQTEVLSMSEARARGAMMIFEEKYGEVVRLITMGESAELCGGTHARATGEIGLLKIVSEQGIAAGVRRIVGVTGHAALGHLRGVEHTLSRASEVVKATPASLVERVEKLVAHERVLEKQVEELERRLMLGGGAGGLDAILGQAREVGGVKALGLRTDVADRAALRELAEQLRDKLGESVVLVGSEREGKAQLVLTVSPSLTARWRAGDLIRDIAAMVGGSGGGRPDMAQAGGTDPSRLDEAIARIYELVRPAE
jgi:alanyl-tRNA synthetase